jgi:hypothetical protein
VPLISKASARAATFEDMRVSMIFSFAVTGGAGVFH